MKLLFCMKSNLFPVYFITHCYILLIYGLVFSHFQFLFCVCMYFLQTMIYLEQLLKYVEAAGAMLLMHGESHLALLLLILEMQKKNEFCAHLLYWHS